ncbi:MAG: hypothetical protein OEM07_03515 [Gammaproteobacteria bacterium]|nr:hypothetical protein [Gammaproteobacteria bacterium]
MNKFLIPVISMGLAASVLVGCSGDDAASGSAVSTGYFQDSPVDGLAYSCAPSGQSGVTESGGAFNYVAGDSCTFTLGAVTLGTATAGDIVTPMELVANGTASNATVINIVQLLTTADDDGDPSNGINIPVAVSAAAESWAGIDVSSGTFDSDIAQSVADIDAVYTSRTVTLTSNAAAQTHIETTASCVYSGMFAGDFSIDVTIPVATTVNGDWGVIVFPDGTAHGLSYDSLGGTGDWTGNWNTATNSITLTGSHDSNSGTVTGTAATPNTATGTISGTGYSGTFSGSRIGGSATAAYRFTGYFSGTDRGVFTIDIDAAGTTASGNYYSFDNVLLGNLSGTVDGSGNLSMSYSDSIGNGTVSGNVNLATGAISGGTWLNNTTADNGSFTGSGCKLN